MIFSIYLCMCFNIPFFQTAKECFGFNTIMIKPKSKHTIRHILELPSSLPPSKRPAAKPPDAPWTKRRKLILPPVNKQVGDQQNVFVLYYMLPSSVEVKILL